MSRLKRKRLLVFCVVVTVGASTFICAGSADDRPQIATLAREILNRRCFACHGANGVARKNVFVLDRDRLIASRTVVPGDSSSLRSASSNGRDDGGSPGQGEKNPKNWIGGANLGGSAD
jgi:mono/diheme cytochrome c family protein